MLAIIMDVWCAIRTYPKHAAELGNSTPQEPVFFLKSSSSVVPFGQIDCQNGDIHHELELVVRIGEDLKPDAMAVGLDLTKRTTQDYLKTGGLPWAAAKSFVGATVIGDWVDYCDEAEYDLMINGELKQKTALKQMTWSIEQLLDKLSEWAPLQVGDILFTGTPAGVGPLNRGDSIQVRLSQGNKVLSIHSADCI